MFPTRTNEDEESFQSQKAPVIMKITSSVLQFLLRSGQDILPGSAVCLFLSSLLSLSSCIKEDSQACPPLQVEISVKDKNYFNVDLVSQEARKSESLAFGEYVPTLFYTLRNSETGEIVEQQGIFNVTGDESSYSITFSQALPLGKYALTVWGGLADNASLTDASLTNILHANGNEAHDIYLTHDELVYDIRHTQHSVDMERVTGKLLIEVDNLPISVRYADPSISQVYERVTHLFNYQNPLTVSKSATWKPAMSIVTDVILAPSTGELNSLLHLDFYETMPPATPDLTPKDIYITLKRNELTAVKYVYDDEREDFFIYLLQNDKWELIHNLDID